MDPRDLKNVHGGPRLQSFTFTLKIQGWAKFLEWHFSFVTQGSHIIFLNPQGPQSAAMYLVSFGPASPYPKFG